MTATPKTYDELKEKLAVDHFETSLNAFPEALAKAEAVLATIASLGLAIAPLEPSREMVEAMSAARHDLGEIYPNMYRAAIGAGNLTKGETNHDHHS